MAAKKRSSRTLDTSFPEPDLLPFLNVIFMLILAMVSMAALLPLGVLSSEAQKLSSGSSSSMPPPGEKKPLNLTVYLTPEGFNLSIRGVVKTSDKPNPKNPKAKLPLIAKIEDGATYDFVALTKKLEEIKKQEPDEVQVIITAEETVKFDDIVHTMDAVRIDEQKKPLFPSISFAAGIVG